MEFIISKLQKYEALFFSAVVMLMVFSPGVKAENRDLEIVGWVENVHLMDPGIALKAKLDTGAETSSLDVNIVKKFRKGDKRWVRFSVLDRETGEEHVLVRERLRTVAIVRHDGKRQSRPVVKMKICIANRILDTEVSLIDRSEFTYPLLLGRKALESFALVDPGNTFLSTPDCQPDPEKQENELQDTVP